MTAQLDTRNAVWHVVDEQPAQSQQQVFHVHIDGPGWLQLLLTAQPERILALSVIGGIAGGLVQWPH